MRFIDPHIHMSARTTDDYERMAAAGVVAVIEPAFWLGQPRTHVGTFIDYLSSLVGWERFRASQFGIRHYCTIGLNSKEANNAALAEEVMDILPLFLGKEGVVAVGEIGYDDQTEAEDKFYRAQLQLALDLGMLVQVHTPHRDKKRGTTRSMDVAIEMGLDPGSVIIDHNNEETVQEVLDRGFWAAFTIYPETKMGSERMVEIARRYGSNRIFIDSSADWGKSDPLAVPKTARLMIERGLPRSDVEAICYRNALAAFGPSGQMKEEDWLSQQPRDERLLYLGNSVLRGQVPRVDELPAIPSSTNGGLSNERVGNLGAGKRHERRRSESRRPAGWRGVQPRVHDPLRLSGVFHRTSLRLRESGIRARLVPARARQAPSLRRIHRCQCGCELAGAGARNRRVRADPCRHDGRRRPAGVIAAGEHAKNDAGVLTRLQQHLGELAIDRHSYVVAVGGGALLDMVGFAAATTHRGVRHIRIPTTVLAQNDSGVGVKNGVNAFGKKNFLGCFAPPDAVLNDLCFLRTLHPATASRGWQRPSRFR
jgi:predicted metal-dependent TIM-barrel fold hydrolase